MDTLTPEQRSERMSRVRSHDTKPELELRRLVWGLGYRYRKSRRDLVGHPDLAFIGRKRAIFLHGCFWHRHDCPSGRRSPKSRTDFWNSKFEANVRRDALVRRQLAEVGWKALVIWECELRDPGSVERRVTSFLDA
jgi:DNA mismatch endonuclease (patch repair protein)